MVIFIFSRVFRIYKIFNYLFVCLKKLVKFESNIILLSCWLFFINGYAQKAIITPDKYNFFYQGIYHEFTMHVDNTDCKSIIVTASKGKLIKNNKDDCLFSFKVVDSINKNVSFFVGVQDSNQIRWIDTLYFRLQNVPTPSLSCYFKDTVDLEQVEDHLVFKLDNFNFNTQYMISYSLKVVRKNKIIFIVENITNLPYNIKLKKGDLLLFYNVTSIGDDLITKQIPNFYVIIK